MVDIESVPPVACQTDFEFFLMTMLTSLKKDVIEMKAKEENLDKKMDAVIATQEEIANFLLDKKVTKMTDQVIDFSRKYNYSFPITTLDIFLDFDKDLGQNQFLKNDVVCFFLLHFMSIYKLLLTLYAIQLSISVFTYSCFI